MNAIQRLFISLILCAMGLYGPVFGQTQTTNYITKFWTTPPTVTNSLLFDNGTNIGLGTTSPASKLDIIGGLRTSLSLTGTPTVYIQNDAGSSSQYALQVQGQGQLRSYLSSGGTAYFQTSLSIGTTTNLASKLTLEGTAPATKIREAAAINAAGTSLGLIDFSDNYQPAGAEARINAVRSSIGGSGGLNPTDFVFSTMNNGTTLSERMRIDYRGFVGIGTSTPRAQVVISGAPNTNGGNGSVGALTETFDNTATGTNTTYGGIAFASFPGYDFSVGKKTVNSSTYFQIRRQDGAEYFTIDASGNTGIGTSTPATKFEVVAPNTNAMRALSGASGSYTAFALGRAASDCELGIASASGVYSNFATAGDAVLRSDAEDLIFSARNSVGAIRFGTGQADAEKMTLTNTGNLGVGTTSPSDKVDVVGGRLVVGANSSDVVGGDIIAAANGIGVMGASSNAAGLFLPGGSSVGNIQTFKTGTGTEPDLKLITGKTLQFSSGGSERMRLDLSGKMGIGTTAPRGLLDLGSGGLNKNIRLGDYLDVGETDYGNFVYSGINAVLTSSSVGGSYNRFSPAYAPGQGLVIAQSGGGSGSVDIYGINWNGSTLEKDFPSAFTHVMRIGYDGKVGIGTTSIGTTTKFAVEGTISAREVRVTSGAFPDYVFSDDYKPMPLEELEKQIKQNKHLPEMPTAGDVKRDGLQLGDTQVKLLKKIEELTLYVIDLKKQNDGLKKRVTTLEDSKNQK